MMCILMINQLELDFLHLIILIIFLLFAHESYQMKHKSSNFILGLTGQEDKKQKKNLILSVLSTAGTKV